MDVEIDNSQDWQRKIKNSLQINYGRAPYWHDFRDELLSLLSEPYQKLVDLNLAVILFFLNKLEIKVDWCLSSSLSTNSSGSDLILEICKKTFATSYLSGKAGVNYLDEKDFFCNNIKVVYHNFDHPKYTQFHGGYEPFMSVIDLCLNHGSQSANIIKQM